MFTVADAIEVARHLQSSPRVLLVGGQSLNFWAEQFRHGVPELERLMPFQSRDVDFIGSVRDVKTCAQLLGGQVFLPHIDHHTPETGIVDCLLKGRELRIDFLGSLAGVGVDEAQSTAIPTMSDGILLRVMHPVLVLQSRLANIFTLRRHDDAALNQMRASIYVVREFVKRTATENYRTALDLVEDVFEIVCSPNGLQLMSKYNIDIFQAIQLFPELPKVFAEKRWPIMIKFLAKKRIQQEKTKAAIANRPKARKPR